MIFSGSVSLASLRSSTSSLATLRSGSRDSLATVVENDFDVDDNGVFRSDSVSSSASMSYIFRQSVDNAYKLKTQSIFEAGADNYLEDQDQDVDQNDPVH